MLSNNLFRALPPSQSHNQESYDMDEEEPNLDPAWPHLQVRTLTDTEGLGCCALVEAVVSTMQASVSKGLSS